ncbi:hypothetical protein RPALISO_227 [Ruegeria phage RpAliso]|nr:hypothetical protein RPALISO_227 [Ruegeria phage RpAliso]
MSNTKEKRRTRERKRGGSTGNSGFWEGVMDTFMLGALIEMLGSLLMLPLRLLGGLFAALLD